MPYLQLDQTLINLKCHEHPLRAIVGGKELVRELKEIGSAASLLPAAAAKASMATALEASLGAGV